MRESDPGQAMVILKAATGLGYQSVKVANVSWLRTRKGWAKQYAWVDDPHPFFSWAELGVEAP